MTSARLGPRPVALGQALFVTFLWSTSWVLIKIGLNDLVLSPLTFAGLRYVLAAAILVPFAAAGLRQAGRGIERSGTWGRVALLGLLLYSVTQGAQFAALVHLPSAAVALGLSTTPVIIAFFSMRTTERPTIGQVLSTLALVVGAAIFFGPLELRGGAFLGLLIVGVGVAANACSAMLGRTLARDALPNVGGVLGLTAVSMVVGSVALLVSGLIIEGMPAITANGWLVIGWLAVVNTAFAFVLWNHTLRTLTAVESSVMNNMMLVQIAVLAWVFLGEALDARQIVGLAIAMGGIISVQLARRRPEAG